MNVVINPDLEVNTIGWIAQSEGTTQPVISRTTNPAQVEVGTNALSWIFQNTDDLIAINGAFETNATGWTAPVSGGSIARSTAKAHSGSASLAMAITNTGGSTYTDITPVPTLLSGKMYDFSAWVWLPSGLTLDGLVLMIGDFTVADGWDDMIGDHPTVFDTWQQINVTKMIRDDITDAHVRMLYRYNGIGTIYFDDVRLTESPVATNNSVIWNNQLVPVKPGQKWYIRLFASGNNDQYVGVRDNLGMFRSVSTVPAEFEEIGNGCMFNGSNGRVLETNWTVPSGVTGASIGVNAYVPAGEIWNGAGDSWTMELVQDLPITPPIIGSFGEAVYAQLQPLQFMEEKLSWPLRKYVGALGEMFQRIDVLSEQNWNIMLDVNQIPDEGLPWLGQFVGVVVNASLPPSAQRQQIRDHLGWQRGTVNAMKRELSYVLGDTPFDIRERTLTPYSLKVAVFTAAGTYEYFYDSEASYDTMFDKWGSYQIVFAAGDIDQIEKIILNQKPAAIVWELILSPYGDYWSIQNYFATYQSIMSTFPTYLEMLNYVPSGIAITSYNSVRSNNTYFDLLFHYENYMFVYDTFSTY